ncbi:MAG: hypothetical protein AAF939_05135 [Planctomycetota bacterium]
MKFHPIVMFAFVVGTLTSTDAYGQQPVRSINVTVSQGWCSSESGYIPIRVGVSQVNGKPIQEDIDVEVAITVRPWNRRETVIVSSGIWPTGQKSCELEMYLPCQQLSRTRNFYLEFKMDGRKTGSRNFDFYNLDNPVDQNEGVTTLFVGSGAVRGKETATVKWRRNNRYPDSVNSNGISSNPAARGNALQSIGMNFESCNESDLPKHWIGLTSCERILIEWKDFENLCRKNERQRSNLEAWVAAGGSLIVLGTKDFSNASDFWELLLGDQRKAAIQKGIGDWQVSMPLIKKLDQVLDSYSEYENGQYPPFDSKLKRNEYQSLEIPKFETLADVPVKNQYAFTRYMDGGISIVPKSYARLTRQDAMDLVNQGRLEKLGIATRLGDNRFEFKVPGVGEPPYFLFATLLTLFLITAGPVMLIVLRRSGRLHLLMVLVPVLSLMICTSLTLQNILVIGTARYCRFQSVTHFDHRTNLAVSHQQSAYFFGINPRQYEFTFPSLAIHDNDTSFLPYRLDCLEDGIRHSGGNIATRTHHQFKSLNVISTQKRILIRNLSQQKLDVENRLGVGVKAAVFRTKDGYFGISNLGAEESGAADMIQSSEDGSKISNGVSNWWRSQMSEIYPDLNELEKKRNRFNFQIQGETYIRLFQAFSGDLSLILTEPNSYLAIVEDNPLSPASSDVNVVSKRHLIRGKW